MVGEASSDTPGGPAAFYGNGTNELHMVFDFRLLKSPWHPQRFRRLIQQWDRAVPPGGWPTQVLSNHDNSRHYSRYGRGVDAETASRRARAAALLLLTLRGTPYLYYGEELGMRDVRLRYRQLRDPYTRRYWPFLRGRDPARTPMQWDASPHSGFTTGTPWLPVSPESEHVNVMREAEDRTSLLSFYRKLIWLRKATPALTLGTYREVTGGPLSCLIYLREATGELSERVLIAINFNSDPHTFSLPSLDAEGVILLSTDPHSTGQSFDPAHVGLGPDEGILVRLES
jgi:alpha-glucosidase